MSVNSVGSKILILDDDKNIGTLESKESHDPGLCQARCEMQCLALASGWNAMLLCAAYMRP